MAKQKNKVFFFPWRATPGMAGRLCWPRQHLSPKASGAGRMLPMAPTLPMAPGSPYKLSFRGFRPQTPGCLDGSGKVGALAGFSFWAAADRVKANCRPAATSTHASDAATPARMEGSRPSNPASATRFVMSRGRWNHGLRFAGPRAPCLKKLERRPHCREAGWLQDHVAFNGAECAIRAVRAAYGVGSGRNTPWPAKAMGRSALLAAARSAGKRLRARRSCLQRSAWARNVGPFKPATHLCRNDPLTLDLPVRTAFGRCNLKHRL